MPHTDVTYQFAQDRLAAYRDEVARDRLANDGAPDRTQRAAVVPSFARRMAAVLRVPSRPVAV